MKEKFHCEAPQVSNPETCGVFIACVRRRAYIYDLDRKTAAEDFRWKFHAAVFLQVQSLSPEAAMPCSRYFCPKKKISRAGVSIRTEAAKEMPALPVDICGR